MLTTGSRGLAKGTYPKQAVSFPQTQTPLCPPVPPCAPLQWLSISQQQVDGLCQTACRGGLPTAMAVSTWALTRHHGNKQMGTHPSPWQQADGLSPIAMAAAEGLCPLLYTTTPHACTTTATHYSMGTGQSRVEPHGSGNLHSEPKLVCSLCYLHNLQRLHSNNLVSCQSALQGTTAGIMLKGTFCQNKQRVSYRIHTQFDILVGRPSAQCRPGKKL